MSVNQLKDGSLIKLAGSGVGSIVTVTLSSSKGNSVVAIPVTLSISGLTYLAKTNSDGVAKFNNVQAIGKATITAENFISKSINIECFSLYTIGMMDGIPYEGWLQSAGLSTSSYTSIEDVLADEKVVRQLLTKTDSVDYLVSWISADSETANIVLNDIYVAKWVNYREYAYNNLSVVPALKSIMDESGMYGMYITTEKAVGSEALVPTLTSNTGSDGGTASTNISDSTPWYAFDGDWETTGWGGPNGTSSTDIWLAYTFAKPAKVNKIELKFDYGVTWGTTSCTYKIQGSNDGTNWYNVSDVFSDVEDTIVKEFENDKYYKAYRLYILSQTRSDGSTAYGGIMKLQFYGYQLIPMIPAMTSDTAPSGIVSASSQFNSTGQYAPWRAFDGDITTNGFIPSTSDTFGSAYVQYKFDNPIKASVVKVYNKVGGDTSAISNYRLQASNDGEDFVTLTELSEISQGIELYYNIDTIEAYTYFRFVYVSNTINNFDNGNGFKFQLYSTEKWQPKGLVPVMTSNTAPYGEVSASDQYDSSTAAYKAFDGDSSDNGKWAGALVNIGASATKWIQYKFTNPTMVRKVSFIPRTASTGVYSWQAVKIQCSNDGSTWVDLYSDTTVRNEQTTYNLEVPNDTYYMYVRMEMTVKNNHTVNATAVSILEMQFYGRQLEALVPPMTSNTSPIGEAFEENILHNWSDNSLTYPAWIAFDGTTGNAAGTSINHAGVNYPGGVGYKFDKPMCVKHVYIHLGYYAGVSQDYSPKSITVQASNDGIDWIDLETIDNTAMKQYYNVPLNNDESYLRYRLYVTTANGSGGYTAFLEIQFYGTPDYDSRTYIYDHGVELMELVGYTYNNASYVAEKQIDRLYLKKEGSGSAAFTTVSKIDMTNYSLMSARLDTDILDLVNCYIANSDISPWVYAHSMSAGGGYKIISTYDGAYLDENNVNSEVYALILIETGGSYSETLTVNEWWLE